MARAGRTLDNREIVICALGVLVLVLLTRYLYAGNDSVYHGLYLCPATLLIIALVFFSYDVWKRLR
jgi:hypothetical protein